MGPGTLEMNKLNGGTGSSSRSRLARRLACGAPPRCQLTRGVNQPSHAPRSHRTSLILGRSASKSTWACVGRGRSPQAVVSSAANPPTALILAARRECLPRHRHEEFLKFLRTIDNQVPKHLAVHLILDNYATHNHADVQTWLGRHQRFHLHFTPTSSSWLNLVERWFRELTDKALRRGSFNSVPDLITAIEEYLDAHNHDPKPFIWTATAESILEKVRRGRVTLEQVVTQ